LQLGGHLTKASGTEVVAVPASSTTNYFGRGGLTPVAVALNREAKVVQREEKCNKIITQGTLYMQY
jgi:hypothetical protein